MPRPTRSSTGTVTTDSREVAAGGVFFAKRGEFDDGHRFAPAAAEQGAALLVVEHALDLPVPQVVVADTVDALGALATEVVRRVRALGRLRIVGVTGSNGKTTTKNLLRADARAASAPPSRRARRSTTRSARPITMLELTDDTEFLVAEMGASAVGEIARLVRMARPDVGIVLKVGLAHAGEFGGIEQTVRAKSEMVTDLLADGCRGAERRRPAGRAHGRPHRRPRRVVRPRRRRRRARRPTSSSHARGTEFTVDGRPAASPLACASACSASTTS